MSSRAPRPSARRRARQRHRSSEGSALPLVIGGGAVLLAFAAAGLWSTSGSPPAPRVASDAQSSEEPPAPDPVANVRAAEKERAVEPLEEPPAVEPPPEPPASEPQPPEPPAEAPAVEAEPQPLGLPTKSQCSQCLSLDDLDLESGAEEGDPQVTRRVRELRGRAYRRLDRDPAEAEVLLREALALQPDAPLTLLRLSQASARQGNYRAAIAACDSALEVEADLPGVYLARGEAKAKLGDGEGALADYDRALELDGEFLVALNSRGAFLAREKRYDEALRDYDRLLELNPLRADGYLNRGVIHDLRGRALEAALDYGTALYVDSDHPQADKLGRLLKRAAGSLGRAQRGRLARELKARGELLEDHPLATVIRSSQVNPKVEEGCMQVETGCVLRRAPDGTLYCGRVDFDELGRRKESKLADIEQPERFASQGPRLGLR